MVESLQAKLCKRGMASPTNIRCVTLSWTCLETISGRVLITLHTHHFHIGLVVEGLSEHGHHKDVDEERDEEGDRGLDEVVLVGFLNFILVTAVDLTRLRYKRRRKTVSIIVEYFIFH